MKRDPLAYEGEVAAEIQSTLRQGPLLVGLLVSMLVSILTDFLEIFVASAWYLSIISISAFLLFLSLGVAGWLRQIRAGPVTAWFKQRSEQVYARLEGDDFVVRLPGKREVYKPSKLEWIDDKTLKIAEGPTSLQLAFRSPDDARQIASGISRILERHGPTI